MNGYRIFLTKLKIKKLSYLLLGWSLGWTYIEAWYSESKAVVNLKRVGQAYEGHSQNDQPLG